MISTPLPLSFLGVPPLLCVVELFALSVMYIYLFSSIYHETPKTPPPAPPLTKKAVQKFILFLSDLSLSLAWICRV